METNTNTTQATLQRLLDENGKYALAGKGTTNHCPMALVALARMGASPARLQAFHEDWSQRYATLETEADMPITPHNWHEQVGVAAAFPSLRQYFMRWMAADGVATVLPAVFSTVPLAPATGAFHALIRTSYGIEAGHAGEISAGLAAYVVNNLPISLDLSERSAISSARAGLRQLSCALHGRPLPGDTITSRLRAVAADPLFQQAMAPLASSLADLAALAAALYWQTANFTVLHMVTGVHAARLVCGQLPAALAEQMYAALWLAFCAAYVSVGAPPLATPDVPAAPRDWPWLFAEATQAHDDHVIKLVYTCHQESLAYPELPYQSVAERLLTVRP